MNGPFTIIGAPTKINALAAGVAGLLPLNANGDTAGFVLVQCQATSVCNVLTSVAATPVMTAAHEGMILVKGDNLVLKVPPGHKYLQTWANNAEVIDVSPLEERPGVGG